MKHLLFFSLKRRFFNRMMLFFVIIMSLLMVLVGFVDVVVLTFNPKLTDTLWIKLVNFDQQLFVEHADYPFELDEFARIHLIQQKHRYLIKSPDELDSPIQQQLRLSLSKYHYQRVFKTLDADHKASLKALAEPVIENDFIETEDTAQKHHLAFYGITTVYFMMISFAAMISQEIIAEKQSNILELIGTSVSLKTHYYSKILGGWLSVVIQVGLMGALVLSVIILRIGFDNGVGWLKFMEDLKVFSFECTSITDGLSSLFSKVNVLGVLLLSLVYLFLGILTLQIFLVRITLRVKNIEEAASVQSPVYIILLFLYYGAMFLNNPDSMQKGLAMFLSFFPFFSMIFMPSRLLLYSVSLVQLFLSFFLSLGCFIYLLKSTEKLYESCILTGIQD